MISIDLVWLISRIFEKLRLWKAHPSTIFYSRVLHIKILIRKLKSLLNNLLFQHCSMDECGNFRSKMWKCGGLKSSLALMGSFAITVIDQNIEWQVSLEHSAQWWYRDTGWITRYLLRLAGKASQYTFSTSTLWSSMSNKSRIQYGKGDAQENTSCSAVK